MRKRGGYSAVQSLRPELFGPACNSDVSLLLELARKYKADVPGFLVINGRRLHHERSQEGMDCQLITAINAAAFLGLPTLSPYLNKAAYEGWMEYTRTSFQHNEDDMHHGRFAEFLKYLRIKAVPFSVVKVSAIRMQLKLGYPVELMLKFGPRRDEGSHSTLVVDVDDKDRIRCTNLYDCENGWTDWRRLWEMMAHYANAYTNGKPIAYSYRPTGKVLMKR